MAKLPTRIPLLVDRFGPHLHTVPPGGWTSMEEPDRIVQTHCCFCGQQCGIQLKVKDNKVVGFEPWEDFPFNLGKLCPKGVKRYLQGDHPDRLLTPLERIEGRRLPCDGLGRGARPHERRNPPHPGQARARRVRDPHWGVAHEREGVPHGEVRARRRAYCEHRLQRPALHGVGGGGVEEDPRLRPRREPVERHPPCEVHPRRGRQRRRVRPHHH